MRLARIVCAALSFLSVAVAADDFEQLRDAVARGDYSAAVPALQAAAEHDDPRAICLLASLYQQGQGFPHDAAKALSLYTRAAQLGDAQAQFNLGNIYLLGDGVPVDEAWALTYYRQAAAQGHAGATRNLDELYRASGLSPSPASARPSVRPLPDEAARDITVRPPARATVETLSTAPSGPSDDELRAIELARAAGVEVMLDETAASPAVPVVLMTRPATPTADPDSPPAFTPSSAASDPDTVENNEEGEAAYGTAQRYLRGQGVARDPAIGIQWLQRAARAGHAQAKYQLALHYLNGQGVIADEAMAITLLRDAAQAGHSLARARLKQVYGAAGLPLPELTRPQQPLAPAREGRQTSSAAAGDAARSSPAWQIDAASSSTPVAAMAASVGSRRAVGVRQGIPAGAMPASAANSAPERRGDASERHATRGAVAGMMADAAAEEESELADSAMDGEENAPATASLPTLGAEPAAPVSAPVVHAPALAVTLADARAALGAHDFARAASIFTTLAERGDAEAQAHIGYMTYQGEGVPVDKAKAVQWYRKAALQGNRDAQYNLAVAYAFGDGVARNGAEALLWYRRAAEQGSAVAQYSLGVSYALGEGAAQSDEEAVKWYSAAAEQGYADAQYNLGDMLRAGRGTPISERDALHWFTEAARNGNASAQYTLGNTYRDGNGVERDLTEARHWYKLAAAQGHREAQAGLAALQASR